MATSLQCTRADKVFTVTGQARPCRQFREELGMKRKGQEHVNNGQFCMAELGKTEWTVGHGFGEKESR